MTSAKSAIAAPRAINAQGSGYTTAGFFTGVFIAVAVCAVVGIVHGILVTYFSIPAFVVTLATKYLLYGFVLLVSSGRYINIIDDGIMYKLGNGRLFDAIPMPVVIFVVYAAICALILSKTVFGRRLYAVGGNPVASNLVGIKTNATVLISYVLCSISAGIGGMILVSQNMIAGATTAAVAGWWYVGNMVRHGSPVPSTEAWLYTSDLQPPGFEPDTIWYLTRFAAWLPQRFFGWFGWFQVPMGLAVTIIASSLSTAARPVPQKSSRPAEPAGMLPSRAGCPQYATRQHRPRLQHVLAKTGCHR